MATNNSANEHEPFVEPTLRLPRGAPPPRRQVAFKPPSGPSRSLLAPQRQPRLRTSAPGNHAIPGRKKVALKPGHSALDWARLRRSGANLTGIDPSNFPVIVTSSILSRHNTITDCWTALGDKVYNITPYLDFHPGGIDELMRCAGKDGTDLFMTTHGWVNWERILDACLIGFYKR